MKRQLEDAKHDFIRYANCWEDADILLEGLQVNETDKVFSIGSAGDNSFSLLSKSPQLVLAVDINATQLHLIELKKAAFAHLEYTEFLEFLGFRVSNQRLQTFSELSKHLPKPSAQYWNLHLDQIESGIIYQGKFEKYFKLFRTKVLPLVHSQKKIQQLFETKSDHQQRLFFDNTWNSWRWRGFFAVFFSKLVMGRVGRDPAFLKEVNIPVSQFIQAQAKRHLSSIACQNNYFLHFIMNGMFSTTLPHYAREDHFKTIKQHTDKLQTFHGLAEEAFEKHGKFDVFNLSNIFEYMNPKVFSEVSSNIIDHANDKARFGYWNLMVNRTIGSVNKNVQCNSRLSKALTNKDKGFFYSGFYIDEKL